MLINDGNTWKKSINKSDPESPPRVPTVKDKLIAVEEVNRAANTSSIKRAGILSERQDIEIAEGRK